MNLNIIGIIAGLIGLIGLVRIWRQNRVLLHRVDYWEFVAVQMSEWWWSSATEKAKVLNEFADYRKFAEAESAMWAESVNVSRRQVKEDGERQDEMLADLLEMSKERDEAVKDALADRLNYEGAMMQLAQLQEKMEKGKKRSHKKGGAR